jgi:hypothetical protein
LEGNAGQAIGKGNRFVQKRLLLRRLKKASETLDLIGVENFTGSLISGLLIVGS